MEDKESLFGAWARQSNTAFYEPFLADFDPDLRKKLGVWYTPPEIVRYMVERTDRVLREELNITDGLANDRVHVLDPCGGTGAYVAETLRRIYRTCQERGDGELPHKRLKMPLLSAYSVLRFYRLPMLSRTANRRIVGRNRRTVEKK